MLAAEIEKASWCWPFCLRLLGSLAEVGVRSQSWAELEFFSVHMVTHLSGLSECPAMHRILRHTGNGRYFCPICNEPVKLETAKADEDGHAVHADCYVDKLCGKIPPKRASA